jgi:AraC-like DNA-binding protein
MASRIIKASEFFEPGLYPVIVIDNEHHDRTSLHRHEFFELVFIDRGIALHSHEGHTEILTTGDIFLILPGEEHSYISTNNTALYNCLFTAEALHGLDSDLQCVGELSGLLNPGRQERFRRVHAGVAERQEIILKLGQLIWERLNRPVGWQLKCKVLLVDLLIAYARLASSRQKIDSEPGSSFRQILKAAAYIENHCERELLVEEIAQASGLSVSYLSRQFKGYLGTSPSEYVRNFRIAKAADLLRQSERQVADIAREMGFGDITLFSRQFRQVTGISPTQFRKNRQE